jgi:putative IMPACT (imprinted ancient) family translation regulator
MMAALLRHNKVMRATHNMLAYRIAVPEKGVMLQDYDDDGEDAAGRRMLHLLQVSWWLIALLAQVDCCVRELLAPALGSATACPPPFS